jgi:alkylation response protein AidB-like acyl-CoA dehydrogenase
MERHGGVTAGHRLDAAARHGRTSTIYTIFEGTSEIQRLVIARAISGVHIR